MSEEQPKPEEQPTPEQVLAPEAPTAPEAPAPVSEAPAEQAPAPEAPTAPEQSPTVPEQAPVGESAPASAEPVEPEQNLGPELHHHPDKPDNMVYVGRKNVMSYVLAVVTQFNQGVSEVRLKARGKSISRAVDASQIVKNRFIPDLKFKDIILSTEELMSEDGSTSKVSSMEILMTK